MNYLIASHGEYAKGLGSAIMKLAGSSKEIHTICAYMDEIPLEAKMKDLMDGREAENWIIFTDLLGGSVNQYMMQHLLKPNIRILTGINLELILLVMKLEETDSLDEEIAHCVEQARSQICYVNSLINEKGRDA